MLKIITIVVIAYFILLLPANIACGNQNIKQLDKQNLKDFFSFPLKVVIWWKVESGF